jgi:hypothetical protein
MQIQLKYICNNGEISDILNVGEPSGRSDTKFMGDLGAVKHVEACYGNNKLIIPRGKTGIIQSNTLPAIELEVADKPKKVFVRYQHLEEKLGKEESHEEYKNRWKQAVPEPQRN